jgi:hypothetical protein
MEEADTPFDGGNRGLNEIIFRFWQNWQNSPIEVALGG